MMAISEAQGRVKTMSSGLRIQGLGFNAPATGFPGLEVSWDEAFAHDGLQDVCEDALVVVEGVFAQEVPHYHWIRNNDEGLGSEFELEDGTRFNEPAIDSSSRRGIISSEVRLINNC